MLVNQPITVLGLTPVGQNPLVILITLPINLAILVYYLAALLNALAAGSGRNRWLLFGVWLLVSLITVFVVPYAMGALLYPLGIHVAAPF